MCVCVCVCVCAHVCACACVCFVCVYVSVCLCVVSLVHATQRSRGILISCAHRLTYLLLCILINAHLHALFAHTKLSNPVTDVQ